MRRRFVENPFVVLELPTEATRAEIEGAGQRLLAMLELGVGAAGTVRTPYGAAPRSTDDVRRALAELRDPAKRLMHELWARGARAEVRAAEAPAVAGWPGAKKAVGF